MIIKTLCAGIPKLVTNYRMSKPKDFYGGICFEVLGFDIMIDNNLKPWLLEINCRPSFQTDTPLDYKIKKGIIKETL